MRKKIGLLISASALSIAALSVFPSPAHACSCAPKPPLKKAVQEADAVFSGIAVRGEFPNEVEAINDTLGKVRWTFLVVSSGKGDGRLFTNVVSHSQGTACGIQFSIGGRYHVFAYENERGELETNSCMRTKASFEPLSVDNAKTVAPLSRISEHDPSEPSTSSSIWMALLGIPVLGAGVVLLLRRRQPLHAPSHDA